MNFIIDTESQNQITKLIYSDRLDGIKKLDQIFQNDPLLKLSNLNPQIQSQSRLELFKHKMKETKALQQVLIDDPNALRYSLSYSIFRATIETLGSQEQKDYILPKIYDWSVIGCYAQTELAHGSDVQSLMTEAIFDKETDSFILNTPSIGAAKYWVGSLGVLSNYAIVQAQVIINGRKKGTFPFLVQLREMDTHKVLPGIEIGDIGPKYGFSQIDNGYMLFNNFKVQRKCMLMKYNVVDDQGNFKQVGDPKITYAGMLITRIGIMAGCWINLSKSVTIGYRYALNRKQFHNHKGKEQAIINYQTQQEKILTPLIDCYSFIFCQQNTMRLAEQNNQNIESKNDFSLLNQLHSLVSMLKAHLTKETIIHIENIRRSCGGHGFSSSSGFTKIYQESAPMVTFEGETSILYLQGARFLVKNFQKCLKRKQIDQLLQFYSQDFDENCKKTISFQNEKDFNNLTNIHLVLQNIAFFTIQKAAIKLQQGIDMGLDSKSAWDKHANSLLIEATIAHCHFYIFQCFLKILEREQVIQPPKVIEILTKLCTYCGLKKLLDGKQVFFASEGNILQKTQFSQIRSNYFKAQKEVLQFSEILIDAFSFNDMALGSVLGSKDGSKMYEKIFDMAANQNIINKPEVQKELFDEMRPIIGKLKPVKQNQIARKPAL